jgi:esterase/lipase superfamily enzyme
MNETAQRWGIAGLLALSVAACTPISAVEGRRPLVAGAELQPVYAATIRASRFEQERESTAFAPFSYSAYGVSIPPDHPPGQLPKHIKGTGVDPAVNFVGVGRRDFAGGNAFASVVAAAPAGELVIFAHGFNTSFADTITTQAQIAHDLHLTGPQVVFGWPAANSPLAYEADQQRAAESSEELAELVEQLAAARPGRVVVAGYSMGAPIVIGALQQLRNNRTLLSRLDVVLFAPDIGVEDFAKMMQGLPPLAAPVTIFGSHSDRILRLARITFHKPGPQLGAAKSAADLPDVPVTFVDVGNVAHTGNGHFTLVCYPPLIAMFTAMPDRHFAAFAQALESYPSAQVTRNGQATYVQLPAIE